MADAKRHRIRNLLQKMNDEDRSTLCLLLIKSGYCVRIGKERPGEKVRRCTLLSIGRRNQVLKPKFMAMKPISRSGTYRKYGYALTLYNYCSCPRCEKILNAGPNYQPRYCSECGQKLDFSDTVWQEEKYLGCSERGGKA